MTPLWKKTLLPNNSQTSVSTCQLCCPLLKAGFINCFSTIHIWYSHNRNSKSHKEVLEIAEGCNKQYKTRIFLGAALVPTGVNGWWGHSLWMNSSGKEAKMTLTQMDLSIGYMWILLMIANKSWWLKLKPCVIRIYQHMKQFHLAL